MPFDYIGPRSFPDYEAYALQFVFDLGSPVAVKNQPLDPFNQFLVSEGEWTGRVSGILTMPMLGARGTRTTVELRSGGTLLLAGLAPERVDNNPPVVGSLPVNGHQRVLALLATLGFGIRMPNNVLVTLDGSVGPGRTEHAIRNAATGATIVDDSHTGFVWDLTGAVTVPVTDRIGVGGFVSVFRTPSFNTRVVGGPPFKLGEGLVTTAGVRLVFRPRAQGNR